MQRLSLDRLEFAALLKPGDVVAVLSNGGFGGIHKKLLEQLG
jgi:UDP-N-acetylmuramate-alanine ligase